MDKFSGKVDVIDGEMLVISHKRHVAIDANCYSVEGGFAAIKNEFSRCVKKVNLCVPVSFSGGMESKVEYAENIKIIPLPIYRNHIGFILRLPGLIRVLWKKISESDLVYAMCPNNMGLLGLVLAKLQNKPVFISIDTDRKQKALAVSNGGFAGKIKAGLIEYSVNSLLKNKARNIPAYITGDMFLGHNDNWKQWVKTTVTSNEVMPLRIENIDNDEVLKVVFVGRISPEKNIQSLIDAVRILFNNNRSVNLKIIGSGSLENKLKKYCSENKLGYIQFLGQMKNTDIRQSRFLGSHVLVLPSKEERQGKVLLEAMASSVPVVAARAGGIPSVINDRQNGVLFDPDNPEDLASSIAEIVDDSEFRRRLIETGYNYACKNTLDKSVAWIISDVARFYGLPVRQDL